VCFTRAKSHVEQRCELHFIRSAQKLTDFCYWNEFV
jgi:hypothetical protein